jgi:hypothetical protein
MWGWRVSGDHPREVHPTHWVGLRGPTLQVTLSCVLFTNSRVLEEFPLTPTETQQVRALFAALQKLHTKAGRPPYRQVSEAAGRSESWSRSALKGPSLAPWDSIARVVDYLGGDQQKIRKLWDAACASRPERPPRPYPQVTLPARPTTDPPPLPPDVHERLDRVVADVFTCLIAIEGGYQPDPDVLGRLPAWQQKLLLSIAEQTGIMLPPDGPPDGPPDVTTPGDTVGD